MPCQGGPTFYETQEDTQKKLDFITNRLCQLLSLIEVGTDVKLLQSGLKIDTNLSAWWALHKKLDKERVKLEKEVKDKAKYRKSAMLKLSDAEQRALGLR